MKFDIRYNLISEQWRLAFRKSFLGRVSSQESQVQGSIMKPTHVTTNEAAEIIGCSAQQVRTLIRKGRIKSTREKSAMSPTKYTYKILLKEVQKYAATVPKKGWPRGVRRK